MQDWNQQLCPRSGVVCLLVLIQLVTNLAGSVLAREKQLLDQGWNYHRGDTPAAASPQFDDTKWTSVDLPHDWSIALIPNPRELSGGGGGFFPMGVGWYRREFFAPEAWRNQRVSVEFEGVYRNAEVWLNGTPVGKHDYGYTPFRCKLNEHLNFGAQNVLAVRVDNSEQPNSRWYSGSGIYRHVWLHVTDPVYVDDETVFVNTKDLSRERARVQVEVAIKNDTSDTRSVTLEVALRDPSGRTCSTTRADIVVAENSQQIIAQEMLISNPHPWSPDSPDLYAATLTLSSQGQQFDQLTIPFGVRTIEVSPEEGLLLNGQPIMLCGANVHHDNGPLGAAAFDRAEQRRVDLLHDAGFNTIRTSHNPPSPAFLSACDAVGMLVIDEAFDGWAAKKNPYDYGVVFAENWRNDLATMVQRDRNHPSVIMWSIGNEVYERGKQSGRDLAREMAAVVQNLDSTRPVTAGINGLGNSGEWTELDPFFAPLDVAGYNYELGHHAEDHTRVPARVIMATETFPVDAFEGWSIVEEYPYVIGDFVWSGMDYLGEAGIGRVFAPDEKVLPHWEGVHFPWHGATCGDIDMTGLRKPLSHYRNIVWNRGEKIYAAVREPTATGQSWQLSLWSQSPTVSSWTWSGHEGKVLTVEVYSRYPSVRLYLNDQLLGEQLTGREQQFRAEFKVTYAPGVLNAVGVDAGRKQEEFALVTASEPAAAKLTADRSVIDADGQDLSFLTVEIVDREGNVCTQANLPTIIDVTGAGTLQGFANGDLASRQSYQSNQQNVFRGRALAVVRSTEKPGGIQVEAHTEGLVPGTIAISSVAP